MNRTATYAGRAADQAELSRRVAKRRRQEWASRPHTLSHFLGSHPSAFDGTKIQAVDKHITHLDVVALRFQLAEVIFASNNAIASLDNIHQFASSLRILSVGNNRILDAESCSGLTACKLLQVLNLKKHLI